MNSKRKFSVALLALGFTVAAYFGAYFLAADYVDVGDQRPLYLLSYRVGSHSLHGLSSFFEPARRIDALCIRRRSAAIVSARAPRPGRREVDECQGRSLRSALLELA